MKVAFLSTSYPAHPADPSGHFVRAEARARAAEGHEVHVVAPQPFAGDTGVEAWSCGGAALFSWPGAAARLAQRPARALAAAPFAARALFYLNSIRPEVLYAHWAVPCGFPLGALCPGARLSVTCHGADVRLLLAAPAPLREAALRALLPRAELRFVASSLREALLAALPPALSAELGRASRVEPPCVAVDERVEPRGAPPSPFALVAARLVSSKRVDLAIRAAARWPGSLVIAGDGPERAALERLASGVAPGRVSFVGLLPRPEVLGWMARSSALLHPSAVEAAPTVVLEALALGVPVICCGAGDTALWAARRSGLRVVEPAVDAIARALEGV